jgi:uncharacterized repeat protein (TIGR04076 family)
LLLPVSKPSEIILSSNTASLGILLQLPVESTHSATMTGDPMPNDEFELWDLRVEVTGKPQDMVCSHTVGDYFELSGENLSFPSGRPFSMYALAAILPLLPAKQRMTHANDWMTTDAEIACPTRISSRFTPSWCRTRRHSIN